jgi:hypothetical protein
LKKEEELHKLKSMEDLNKPNTDTQDVSSVTIENIDDFLPLPGADSVVTSEEDEPKTVFSKAEPTDLGFLDSTEDSDTPKATKEELDSALSELDGEFDESDDATKLGRKKIDKSGMVETFSKLMDEGVLMGFDDDKPMEDYSIKDWKELIQANLEEKERAIREQTPKEFFEALPEELQYAAEYVAKGGKDMKGLFRALAQVEEQRSLDPSNDEHQEMIVRQYLYATNFGSGDQALIEDQIEEWVNSGTISKRANQFKPKLDDMQTQVLQAKLQQQEQFKLQQQQQKEQYMENIYNTLKPGDLNGVKVDGKRQKFLWDELTTLKYQSLQGKPTNLLGRLLEEYQFSNSPRYDLIAETLWLLSDPDDYKEQIRRQGRNQATQETVKKLKTEEARRLSSTVPEEREPTGSSRSSLKKPRNIFSNR